jgi:hypothetical protein
MAPTCGWSVQPPGGWRPLDAPGTLLDVEQEVTIRLAVDAPDSGLAMVRVALAIFGAVDSGELEGRLLEVEANTAMIPAAGLFSRN